MNEKNIGGNYFDKYGSANLAVRFVMNQFLKTMNTIINGEKFDSMLDAGCGEGHLTNIINESLEKNGRHTAITALEYDGKTLDKARILYPNLNLVQGNILELKGNYDLLLASEVLEHINEYDAAIQQCKKTAPVCVFSVPNEPWFRMANLCRLKYLKRLGNTPGHVNNWTKSGFRRILSRHFEYVMIKTAAIWNIALCKKPNII
ncbi:MAG TPA: methyltransferase domain-containing protein [Candidatus Goldiibacteriota bacterium]|nr:methyltransferase domain-containing protein [Candidatus Goldiibacteriota bacterium]HPN64268.1 methyltransferase domain-containing protein [Candidatus Goldiibacteriota bacterium]HRQ43721.1 methyltransferase domain-containing protein [Candidatus Goldiibacteriota bacterium]